MEAEKKAGIFQPALLAGVALGLLSSIPYINMGNMFCCLWIVGGGVLAVYLYKKDGGEITTGNGATLGLLAGLFAAPVEAIVGGLLFWARGNQITASFYTAMQKSDAELPPGLEQMMGMLFGSPVYITLFTFVSALITNAVFATLGGVIGAMIFKPKKVEQL